VTHASDRARGRFRHLAAGAALLVVVAVPAVALLVASRMLRDRAGLQVGERIPPALLLSTSGDWIDTGSWAGSSRLVVLFQARCPACRAEIRTLQAIVRGRASVPSSAVVLLSLDAAEEARAFARDLAGPFTVAIDPSGRLAKRLRRPVVPALYLLDAAGRVALVRTGARDRQQDEALLEALAGGGGDR
jgi:peroxiredoxin